MLLEGKLVGVDRLAGEVHQKRGYSAVSGPVGMRIHPPQNAAFNIL